MKKILIIGALNNILRSISECLAEDYNVQMCSENIDDIKAMISLLKPDLIIVNEIAFDVNETDLFMELSKKYARKPVLIISSGENQEHSGEISKLLPKSTIIYKPVTRSKLLTSCKELLNPDSSVLSDKEQTINKAAGTAAETGSLKDDKKKVLVIDDSVLLLRNMKAMLDDNYQVFTVTSGEIALKSIAKIRPDVILLDYAMPDWDGKKTFEMLSRDEIGRNIPVIFLTSVSEKQQILDVLSLKPFGYILKPPSKDRITEEIGKALGNTCTDGK